MRRNSKKRRRAVALDERSAERRRGHAAGRAPCARREEGARRGPREARGAAAPARASKTKLQGED
ncbi:unnamed protein product [Prorocentrum cordatum]|uniref:Uncharacterized protein n=1 Tax=Prorocentrum cordatum TaxID=2364126 RepID=A0ABN9VU06_9DINO|nr:unnamed protein product [Polarella glacialis]